MKNWLEAAVRYEAAKKSGFKARKKPAPKQQTTPTLKEFLTSEEGKSGMKLLTAAGTYIPLGETEPAMSRSCTISLDGTGLVRSVQVVGMAAAYSKEKPELTAISVPDAMKTLCGIDHEKTEADYVAVIREGLNIIANEAP